MRPPLRLLLEGYDYTKGSRVTKAYFYFRSKPVVKQQIIDVGAGFGHPSRKLFGTAPAWESLRRVSLVETNSPLGLPKLAKYAKALAPAIIEMIGNNSKLG